MKRVFVFVGFSVVSVYVSAQTVHEDTLHRLDEVVVTARLAAREVIPSQTLRGEQLERLNTHSVADALRYFSGVQLKDYGGVGGLKTVNIRSMGTHHVGVSYDGVNLGNAQNGQIDLGQLSLDNVEEITLYNGQKSAIYQPASDFGHAGSVYIRTRRPYFEEGRQTHWRMKAQYGSSDAFRFAALLEQKLSDRLSASLSAGFLTSSGKYKFHYERRFPDGTTAWDTTAIRQNGDIHAERVELNLHGLVRGGTYQLKGYLYNSSRGIPGAIVNNVWKRGERQSDLNTFFQANYQQGIADCFSTRWIAKYAYYYTHYKNNDETQLPVDNTYRQQEFYLSTANVLELLPRWSMSLSYDFKWNKLNADTYNFSFPTRLSNLVSLATAYDGNIVKVQGSVLATFIHDRTTHNAQHSTLNTHRFTPALFVNVYPFGSTFFSLRAYVKESFRMPTFNDLYYTDMGNANLKPERALQWDAGMALNKHFDEGFLSQVSMQADAYYNVVHDKIIAYPKGQQFRWTMLNLGKVHIKGVDVVADATARIPGDVFLTTRVQYTYQDARDVTDPNTSYYRHQIPYIPWHSGSFILGLAYQGWTLNYSFIYTGERYDEQENIIYNHMEPWYTNDLSISYEKQLKSYKLKAQLEVNNLLSQDYEVIVNYPMPKRNYMLSLTVEY